MGAPRFDDIEGEVQEAPAPRFDDIEGDVAEPSEPAAAKPEIPKTASLAGGAFQGFGMGFGDELVGAKNALVTEGVRGASKLFGKDSAIAKGAKDLALTESLLLSNDAKQGKRALDAYKDGEAAGPSAASLEGSYTASRDDVRKLIEEVKQANPKTFMAGEIGGAVAVPLPFGKATAAGKLGRLGQTLGREAVVGSAYGAGASDANVLDGDFGELALDMGIGAGGSIVGYGAGKYVLGPILSKGGQLVKQLPEKIRQLGERRAFKAAGPMLKDFRNADGLEGAQEIGRDLIDQGVVTFGRDAEQIANAAVPKAKEIGQKIGDVRKKLDELLPDDVLPTGEALAKRIREEVAAPLLASPANRKFASAVLEMADEFAKEGSKPVNMSKLTAWKKELADQISFGPDPSFPQQLKNAVRGILQKEEDKLAKIGLNEDHSVNQLARFADDMDELAKASGDDGSSAIAARMRELASKVGKDTEAYRELKRLYGNLVETAKFSSDQSLRQQANRILSPSDHGVGSVAAIGSLANGGKPAESTIQAMLLAYGNKLLRERGNSAAAVALDKLSRLPGLGWVTRLSGAGVETLGKYAPQILRAAGRGPHALQMTLQLLGEMDPDFKALQQQEEPAP